MMNTTIPSVLRNKATYSHRLWPEDALPSSLKLMNEVTRKTFKRNVETYSYFAASDAFGYERAYQKGMTLAGSPYVSFYRATYHGDKAWVIRDTWNGTAIFTERPDYSMTQLSERQQRVVNEAVAIIEEAKPPMYGTLTNKANAVNLLQLKIGHSTREQFLVLYLSSQHELISADVEFTGTINSASVYPREIVKKTLMYDAAAVILSHNHPSGKVEPSMADKSLTTSIKEALAVIDVPVLDHIIVGHGASYSFAEHHHI